MSDYFTGGRTRAARVAHADNARTAMFMKLLDRFPSSDYHGLKNQGATCYLNSVLQVLFMTENFREAVKGCQGQDFSTIDPQLERLFAELQRGTADPRPVTEKLGITNGDLYEQRDASEYFEKILSLTGHEASKIFKGKLRHTTTCSMCQKHTTLEEQFLTLPLSMGNSSHQTYSVENGFEAFFTPIKIVENNRIYCHQCDAKTDATIGCEMAHYPDVLTLLLKRFDYDEWSYVKLNHCVSVPERLQTESCTYELYAFVNHCGSLHGGHYTAEIKSYDTGKWYLFDDTNVKMVNLSHTRSGDTAIRSYFAYLLMYKKDIGNRKWNRPGNPLYKNR
ncbi:ubiquitin carboxyl-terminal hydrolase 47 isoform X2 [Lampris incognitus]|uniref:ubiquitin carboxyl-terminal hydrolase 47 isoform X2 n=1 Tax=Lampris incognitus TaxID=2546036 RepID=UPI0024B59466|nr:ubiquitin carboxyl-terminal hydrolase 47 isoform X2 [Lampris incognitus]